MIDFKRMISLLCHLKVRKRKDWNEVSTIAIVLLAMGCWLETAFHGYVFKKFAPGYVDLANHPGAMTSVPFLIAGGLLLLSGAQFLAWGIAAKNLTALLEKRIWPK